MTVDMDSKNADEPQQQTTKGDVGFVILRYNDKLDPEHLVFEPQKRGETVRIKYKKDGKPKILYLQSAPSYVRTPLIVEGQLQTTIDFDLCEMSSDKNREFVRKLRTVETAMKTYLAKTGSEDTDAFNLDNLLKSSLRVLTKTSRKRMPAFRISTNSFDTKAIFGNVTPGEDADVVEDARANFIVEVFGLKSVKKSGIAQGLWRLSQLKVLEDKAEERADANMLGPECAFEEEDE